MEDKKLQEGLQKPGTNTNKTKPGSDDIKEESPVKNDTDTEPDEFIGTNADTDQPIDGQVINDAVLRGEPHANTEINWPAQDNKNKRDIPPKKDAEKL